MDINTASGEAAGVPEEKFARLGEYATSPLFTPVERLALAYADGMTIGGQDVSDELFAALREHFSEEAMVELTAHAAFENFRSRFNHALRIEAQGFCRVPGRAHPRGSRTMRRCDPQQGTPGGFPKAPR